MQHQKTALVVGLTARTSYSLGLGLLKRGYSVVFSDRVDNEEKRALISKLSCHGNVVSVLGRQEPSLLSEYRPEMVLPSPGVPMTIPLLREALKRKIPVLGDIELFYRWHPALRYIGVTGTDGKTTTSSLLYDMIRREKKSFLGGNIGTPLFDFDDTEAEWAVLELSSFQIETITNFHPSIAALLNIAPDHQDRYKDMDKYLSAKMRLFKNMQTGDCAVLNADSAYSETCLESMPIRPKLFSRKSPDTDAYYDGKMLFLAGRAFVRREGIALHGDHNVENAMAAILMAQAAGVSDEAVKKTLSDFHGLPHRLEYVCTRHGIRFYNDSKSTTVNSMQKALESFNEPLILIAGGRDKGLDFRPLQALAREKLRTLVLIGEAADKIEKELDFKPVEKAITMKEAIKKAMRAANAGDVIILSPGCASFDMYKNYEERGEDFKRIVATL